MRYPSCIHCPGARVSLDKHRQSEPVRSWHRRFYCWTLVCFSQRNSSKMSPPTQVVMKTAPGYRMGPLLCVADTAHTSRWLSDGLGVDSLVMGLRHWICLTGAVSSSLLSLQPPGSRGWEEDAYHSLVRVLETPFLTVKGG